MLKLWNDLERKFFIRDKTVVRHLLLIAKLLFWLIYSAYISDNDIYVYKSFVAFFGLEED